MQMTNGEICRSFKEAADPKRQVKVLAELNACGVRQIADILRAGGCAVPPLRGVPMPSRAEVQAEDAADAAAGTEVRTPEKPKSAKNPPIGEVPLPLPAQGVFTEEETDALLFALHKAMAECERELARYAEAIEKDGARLDRFRALLKKLQGGI